MSRALARRLARVEAAVTATRAGEAAATAAAGGGGLERKRHLKPTLRAG